MTRHIIFGGNGFLGRELVEQLLQFSTDKIVVIDPQMRSDFELYQQKGVEFIQSSIADSLDNQLIEIQPDDIVHHLASKLIIPNRPRIGRYDFFAEANVVGTMLIVEAMVAAGSRNLHFWSTDMVYGPVKLKPRTEEHPLFPFGHYGKAKVAGENIVREYVAKGALNCTIFRPRLIIGAGRLGILETLFKLIHKGLPIPLIGFGKNRFQFVSVHDCARASIMALKKDNPCETFNLGSANPPMVSELLEDLIREVSSKSFLLKTPGSLTKFALEVLNLLKISPMDPEQYRIADLDVSLDIAKAETLIDWVPQDHDSQMLRSAYEHWLEHRNE